jgi:hypothetical protein
MSDSAGITAVIDAATAGVIAPPKVDPPVAPIVQLVYVIPASDAPIRLSAQTDRPAEILKEAVTYCWKDVTQTGDWKIPNGNIELSITPTRQRAWARKVREMVACGINIPIVAGVINPITLKLDPHFVCPQTTYGRVVDAKVDGNRLSLELMLIGDEARKLAARNEVSIYIPREPLVDGKGRVWDDAITSLALTQNPVIGNQNLPVAASFTGEKCEAIALSLSGAQPMDNNIPNATPGASGMGDMVNLPCSGACLSELHSAIPGLSDKPVEAKMPHILQHVKKMGMVAGGIGAPPGDSTGDGYSLTADAMGTALSFSRTLAASRIPENRDAVIDAVTAAKQRAVDCGAILPAVADKIMALVVGDPKGKTNDICLSRVSSISEDKKCIALSIFASLADNKPTVDTGRKTGEQVVLGADGKVVNDVQRSAQIVDYCLAMAGAGATGEVNM